MWLEEFRKLFPEASALIAGQPQDLEAVERALATARASMRVGPAELHIIEATVAWSYLTWWPRLSRILDMDVQLPNDLATHRAKRQAVEILHDRLKHIEVVSVVLRFLRPDEFGILSPPVSSLLKLVPPDNHIDDYMRYLDTLQNLRDYYRDHLASKRLADIDMALWVAAHHSHNPQWASLKDEMDQDQHFQELRLRNLVEGFGRLFPQTDRQRLLFARAIVKHDHLTAALIAARSFESLILELARQLGIRPSPKPGQTKLGNLVDAVGREARKLPFLRLSPEDPDRWWKWRRRAVHYDSQRPISKREAQHFVEEIEQLWDRLYKSKSS